MSDCWEVGRRLVGNWKELGLDASCINYAFCGNTGSGKSSLINALRMVKDSDKGHTQLPPSHLVLGQRETAAGAAAVGENETTMSIKEYRDARLDFVRYWDLPGGNTVKHPGGEYFRVSPPPSSPIPLLPAERGTGAGECR